MVSECRKTKFTAVSDFVFDEIGFSALFRVFCGLIFDRGTRGKTRKPVNPIFSHWNDSPTRTENFKISLRFAFRNDRLLETPRGQL